MYKTSAPRRTGVYRVSGNISDLQIELKLKHISEWLPVPKFEYNGNPHEQQPESSRGSNSWSNCYIYLPHCEENNGYAAHGSASGYYNYYNPGSGYPPSSARTGSSSHSYSTSKRSASRERATSSSEQEPDEEEEEEAASQSKEERRSSESPTKANSSHSQQELSVVSDAFYALNKELCNGGTANLLIGWQQKHFSRAELSRYRELGNCLTTLQRRYHRWTQDIIELQQRHELEQEEQQVRIRRHPRKSKAKSRARSKSSTSLPSSSANASSLSLSSLHMSDFSLVEDPNWAARTCLIHTVIDADEQQPAEQEARQTGYQLMHVYADLQPDTLLFSLKYAPDLALLYVYPDFSFSADDLDYIVEIDNDCRQLYAYGFQNVTPLQPAEQARSSEEEEQQPLLSDRDSESEFTSTSDASSAVAALLRFSLPPKRMRRVSLLLQLHRAELFEYNNVHVRYYIQPPPSTLLEPSDMEDPFPLRGATQTCLEGGAARPAHLAHCWQLTLLCEEQYDPSQLLHIYFEVISVDSWQRERCEGYAYYACSLLAPLPTGEQRLHCVRPLGSWLDALKRHFIGGRALFDFVGYFNAGSRTGQYMLHNRLEASSRAQAMLSTGSLIFSAQKLQQRQPDGGLPQQLESDGDDGRMSGGDANEGKSTLEEVLAAYAEARERIESLLSYRNVVAV